MHFRFYGRSLLLSCFLLLLGGPVSAQWSDYLNPGFQFETMAMANASFILSQSRQNLAMQYIPIELDSMKRRRLQRERQNAGQPEQRTARGQQGAVGYPPAGSVARRPEDYAATDFRPRRQRSIGEQFAALSSDPAHRPVLRQLGDSIIAELERSPDFRRNNLTYAIGLAVGGALSTLSGRELTDEQSFYILDQVHTFLTESQVLNGRTPEELTGVYDTFVLFAGLMSLLEADARANGHEASMAAAREVARTTLKVFGLKAPGEQ